MNDALSSILDRHRSGEAVAITSVCSASPLVIQAACEQAAADGGAVLIEATSNQVDQFGGYTGMRPAGFRDLVHKIAERAGLPLDRVVLGGDQRVARCYSYSDRVRYYWPDPQVSAGVERLVRNLRAYPPPLPLISAHLPEQYARVRAGVLEPDPIALALDHVRDVLRAYSTACTTEPSRSLS